MKVLGKIWEVVKAVGRFVRDLYDWEFIWHVIMGVYLSFLILIAIDAVKKFFGI